MTYLLDANVLIARSTPGHVFFGRVQSWLRMNPNFAVCPITEGALVRAALFSGRTGAIARETVKLLAELPGYEFWPDSLSYREIDLARLSGHKQVTDAYLVALAKHHGGRLATLDEGLAVIHPEAVLVT